MNRGRRRLVPPVREWRLILATQGALAAIATAWGVAQDGFAGLAWAGGLALVFGGAMWLAIRRDLSKAFRTKEPSPPGAEVESLARTVACELSLLVVIALFLYVVARAGDAAFPAGLLLGLCVHATLVLAALQRAERERGVLLRERGGWRSILHPSRFRIGRPSPTAPPPTLPEKPA